VQSNETTAGVTPRTGFPVMATEDVAQLAEIGRPAVLQPENVGSSDATVAGNIEYVPLTTVPTRPDAQWNVAPTVVLAIREPPAVEMKVPPPVTVAALELAAPPIATALAAAAVSRIFLIVVNMFWNPISVLTTQNPLAAIWGFTAPRT